MHDALVPIIMNQFPLILLGLGHQTIEISIFVTAGPSLDDLHPAAGLRKSRFGVLGKSFLAIYFIQGKGLQDLILVLGFNRQAEIA